jgi:penicillin-binding protein 1A
MKPRRQRVEVLNPADGGFIYWLLKFYLFGAITLLVAAIASLPALYMAIASNSPPAPNLRSYPATAAMESSIYASDGRLLTTLTKEKRRLVRIEDVPPMLIKAFMAAEDRSYYEHGGIDVRGIMRAAWANLRAGGVRQGGSTITQQVAKAHLSPERSIDRKLKEIVLARRLETTHTKNEILEHYFNRVFFGSHAYGIKAAAHEYFGKRLAKLSLGEMALMAGLVRAPSRYSPRRSLKRATRRRNVVLRAMLDAGYITGAQHDAAVAEKLVLAEHENADPLPTVAPHFAEHVRRTLMRRYGKERLYSAGWTISTTVVPTLQALARKQTLISVEALDKRQGWRGPVKHLRTPLARKRALERISTIYGTLETLQADRSYLAVVNKVARSRATALIGKRKVELPLGLMRWAARYSRTFIENKRTTDSCQNVLKVGDLIWVVSPTRWMRRKNWGSTSDKEPQMRLDQRPRVEGAMYSYDHQSGYSLVMVGGLDYDRSTFNRTIQAERQPGSTYKPIYYSLALDSPKYSMGTIFQDRPYVPEPGEQWNPQNVHGTIDGKVTMHYSLVKSLNLPSLMILARVGYKNAAKWARKLGFSTKIHADKALALGASAVRMDELTRAFATFARNGTQRDPIYIRQIRDRFGRVIEDHTVVEDPMLHEADRLDRIWATSGQRDKQVIDARTAFLMTKLLRDSVLYGIAARCQIVPAPTGGKGGTSSRTMDVWFVGFTSQWATTTWIGDDIYQRPLGKKEASYTSAIPMWANYMKAAIGKRPHRELPIERPPGLRSATIDFLTGGPPKGQRNVVIYYRPGSWHMPPTGKAGRAKPGSH